MIFKHTVFSKECARGANDILQHVQKLSFFAPWEFLGPSRSAKSVFVAPGGVPLERPKHAA